MTRSLLILTGVSGISETSMLRWHPQSIDAVIKKTITRRDTRQHDLKPSTTRAFQSTTTRTAGGLGLPASGGFTRQRR